MPSIPKRSSNHEKVQAQPVDFHGVVLRSWVIRKKADPACRKFGHRRAPYSWRHWDQFLTDVPRCRRISDAWARLCRRHGDRAECDCFFVRHGWEYGRVSTHRLHCPRHRNRHHTARFQTNRSYNAGSYRDRKCFVLNIGLSHRQPDRVPPSWAYPLAICLCGGDKRRDLRSVGRSSGEKAATCHWGGTIP